MKQLIKFKAFDEHTWEVKERPVPASEFIPQWWKDMPVYTGPKYDLSPASNVTSKRCFPLLDAITAGYIVPLWADVLVTLQDDGLPYIKWATHTNVLEAWPHQHSEGYEIPEGFSKTVFKNYHGWIIETPKNYSCYITHPIGFPNLPFRTLTGVVDTDKLKTDANAPFVVKKGFEGIIEKGTPMFQVIPYKREDWKAHYEKQKPDEFFFNTEKLKSKIVSSYGRHMRVLKKYE